jgi:hypothetical protein
MRGELPWLRLQRASRPPRRPRRRSPQRRRRLRRRSPPPLRRRLPRKRLRRRSPPPRKRRSNADANLSIRSSSPSRPAYLQAVARRPESSRAGASSTAMPRLILRLPFRHFDHMTPAGRWPRPRRALPSGAASRKLRRVRQILGNIGDSLARSRRRGVSDAPRVSPSEVAGGAAPAEEISSRALVQEPANT